MSDDDKGFLSEDGSTFTSFTEDDDKSGQNQDNVNVQDSDVESLIKQVDVNSLPEAQRPIFTKLIEAFKSTSTEIGSLKEKANLAEVLERTVAQLNANQQQTNVNKNQTQGEQVVSKLSEKLKFEDKDYYAPFFKELAGAIDSLTERVDGSVKVFQGDKVAAFEQKVKDFVRSNNIPKQVIVQMDEIAKEMGPGAYKNLDKLYKYAKAELGIKDTPVIDINSRKPQNRVEMRNSRRPATSFSDKPVKTMQDAWNKAQGDLAAED
jgi:hypothetical protein